VEVAGIPVTYRGKPAGQIVVRDITERLSAEEQLREADVRYRQFVEHIPAVTYMDIVEEGGGRLGFISPQVEPLLGYPPQRFLDDPGFRRTILHPDDRDRVEEAAHRTIDEGAPFVEEYRMIAADGREIWVHDTSTRVDDDHGNLLYRLGFLTDVTARRQAERRRHVAEERYRMIVEHTPVVVYQEALSEGKYDPETTWNYLSPQVEGVLGYTQDTWESDPAFFWKIVHPDDLERVLAESSRTNESGQPYHQEYRVIAADGREVWVHDDCLLVRDEDGTPLLWQGVMIDITERRRAEDELQRALEVEREAGQRLRAVDEMKNTFLQAVSHDLRTPLAAILGLAVTLERSEVDLDEVDARDLASRIASNARRLERLVSNLLDLDRLSRGIVAPTLEFTEVGALVRRVLSESELLSSARVHTDIAEAVIAADAAKVERIVENLLANCARHTPADAQVWVSTRAVADGALILVEDDGPGVAPELRETIFEAFRQGPHAPKHSPGVGVGLALVRRLAELHGGHAWVEERAAGGASFRVFLPSSPPERVTTAADGTDAEAAEGPGAGWEGGSPDRLDGRPAGDDGMVDGGGAHLRGAAG
jgi:PAS domain S-box-containing protein